MFNYTAGHVNIPRRRVVRAECHTGMYSGENEVKKERQKVKTTQVFFCKKEVSIMGSNEDTLVLGFFEIGRH